MGLGPLYESLDELRFPPKLFLFIEVVALAHITFNKELGRVFSASVVPLQLDEVFVHDVEQAIDLNQVGEGSIGPDLLAHVGGGRLGRGRVDDVVDPQDEGHHPADLAVEQQRLTAGHGQVRARLQLHCDLSMPDFQG